MKIIMFPYSSIKTQYWPRIVEKLKTMSNWEKIGPHFIGRLAMPSVEDLSVPVNFLMSVQGDHPQNFDMWKSPEVAQFPTAN